MRRAMQAAGVATALVGLGSGAASASDLVFVLDDGVGTFTIGPSEFDANTTWMNSFETPPSGAIIDLISVSFGDIDNPSGVQGSDAVTVAILDDPTNDHDPSDAQLLTTAQGVWTDQGFSVFLDFPIAPTRVDGVFFVAVEMDVLQRANPARMDNDAPSAGSRSWLFYNGSSRLDDLGASKFALRMSDSPFLGAWMIRASGSAPCAADLNADGSLNFGDVSAFLGLYAQGDPCVDFDGSGALNFGDVAAFLTRYAQGCP